MVTFAEPDRLLLLALPAVMALLAAWRHRLRLRQQRSLASPAVWARLMGGVPATGLVRMLLWCAAAAALVVALARPQWGVQPAETSVRTRDLVVAIDVSDSMRCPDLAPSRLGRSLQVVRRALPALGGNRIGVVVFAGDAYPLVPLTTDLEAAAMFLESVEPGMVALPGSNIERATAAALELLPEEGEARVVVLVTDGENLQGDPAVAADRLRRSGVGVLAIVAGTEDGGPIPMAGDDGGVRYKRDHEGRPVVTHAHPEVLARLSEAAGGELLHLHEATERELVTLVERLRTRELEAEQRERRVERFPVFLGAAALLLAAAFAVSPWRRLAIAAVLGVMLGSAQFLAAQSPASAGAPRAPIAGPSTGQDAPVASSAAWWQRWIPGGARRLAREGLARWNRGAASEAAGSFAGAAELDPEDPERAFDYGTALAAAGHLDTAMAQLDRAGSRGVRGAAYNAGTAALAQGQAEMAVDKLRQALLADPSAADVKRNYELALKLLEQQQQQQQQQHEEEQQQESQDETPAPTPTPSPAPQPAGQGAPTPTPTPDPNAGLYAALERAEEEARDAMRSPTPQPGQVEKDW